MPDLPPPPAPAPAEAGDAAGDVARILGFLRGFDRRRAPRVLPAPGGFAVLDDRYPGSYDDNKLIVTAAPDPDPGRAAELLVKAADELLAERAHRLLCVDDDRLGAALTPAFAGAGFGRETTLVMTFQGDPPASPPPVERLEPAELVPVLRRDWRQMLPEAPADVIEGLARRVEARLDGADVVRFYGVRAPDGEVAARADLYVHGGVAQIENVFTSPLHRGSGHARTLTTALLAEAATLLSESSAPAAGSNGGGTGGLIFLLADADDWPHRFYRRLGFTPVSRTHAFLRT